MHSHIPKSNKDYWVPKLKKNQERDISKQKRLESQGWSVLRFWEHEEIKSIVGTIEEKQKERKAKATA